MANQLWLLLRSRWHRLGYACVNFGTPVSVRAWAAARGIDFDHLDRERRHAEVAALGRHLMAEVGRLIPVLPVPLVATVLLRDPATAVQPVRPEVGGRHAGQPGWRRAAPGFTCRGRTGTMQSVPACVC